MKIIINHVSLFKRSLADFNKNISSGLRFIRGVREGLVFDFLEIESKKLRKSCSDEDCSFEGQ